MLLGMEKRRDYRMGDDMKFLPDLDLAPKQPTEPSWEKGREIRRLAEIKFLTVHLGALRKNTGETLARIRILKRLNGIGDK